MTGSVDLRKTFARFATGVTVVTVGGGVPYGMTANSFTSVSIDPPLALICVRRDGALCNLAVEQEAFSVSVLAAGQEHLARRFADSSRPRGAAGFAGIELVPGRDGRAPLLSGALAWLDCELAAVYDGGDHSILLGRVAAHARGDVAPALMFFEGAFRSAESDLVQL